MRSKVTTKSKPRLGNIPIDIKAIAAALAEDAPDGDITTESAVPRDTKCVARLTAKQDLTLAGIDLFKAVFMVADPEIKVLRHYRDGQIVGEGEKIATVSGRARPVLAAERVALNFLQRLCGIATGTRRFVRAAGDGVTILDTRKTTPGLRDMEKYAVRCGGGSNHRRDLSDMALIKENHISSAGGIVSAIVRVRETVGSRGFIEVEVRDRAELSLALKAGADRVMLDNMSPADVGDAVKLVGRKAQTEASGNITLENVASYAKTGVDYISVGALTHSTAAADLSLIVDLKTGNPKRKKQR